MAIDGIVRFVGCVNLVVFYLSDFFFAYVLHQLKLDHPAIDECSPNDEDVDAIAIVSTIQRVAQNNFGLDDGGNRGGAYNEPSSTDVPQANLYASPRTPSSGGSSRSTVIHRLVIAASFSAPFFSFLQIVAPTSMQWSLFEVPGWLGYLSTIPGLGACIFYASRAIRVSNFEDVSKSQWLSMMWFRLDMMCVMGTVMLLGWGDWLVAICMFAVALYLAHRLLVTEKRLSAEIKHSQLIREEMDMESLRPSVTTAATTDAPRGYNAIQR